MRGWEKLDSQILKTVNWNAHDGKSIYPNTFLNLRVYYFLHLFRAHRDSRGQLGIGTAVCWYKDGYFKFIRNPKSSCRSRYYLYNHDKAKHGWVGRDYSHSKCDDYICKNYFPYAEIIACSLIFVFYIYCFIVLLVSRLLWIYTWQQPMEVIRADQPWAIICLFGWFSSSYLYTSSFLRVGRKFLKRM